MFRDGSRSYLYLFLKVAFPDELLLTQSLCISLCLVVAESCLYLTHASKLLFSSLYLLVLRLHDDLFRFLPHDADAITDRLDAMRRILDMTPHDLDSPDIWDEILRAQLQAAAAELGR